MKSVFSERKFRVALPIVRCLVATTFILSCVSAVYWFYDKPFIGISVPQYEPIMSALGIIFSILVWGADLLARRSTHDKRTKPLLIEAHEQHLRRELLNLVEMIWIKGKLDQMLGGRGVIEVNKEERPDLIHHPWKIVLQTDRTKKSLLPADSKLIDVFEEVGSKLLILGDPGSGKTTMMLELSRAAIVRAKQDITRPLPFVFNLSTWSDEYETISSWIISELTSSLYKVPKELARTLIENDQLLLLIDGFDAVPSSKREACAQALNKFRHEHGLTQLVVCSRTTDYKHLKTKLQVQGAVVLKPLTRKQIKVYLERLGSSLDGLADVLDSNKALTKLAETPLWLKLMTVTYCGMSADSIRDSIKTKYAGKPRAGDLIHAYVSRMLSSPRGASTYNQNQTIHWLSWLAKNMPPEGLFFIDRMQPLLLGGSAGYYRAIVGGVMCFISHHYVYRNLPLMARITGDPNISNLMYPLLIIIPFHVALQSVAKAVRGIRVVETWRWSWLKASQSLVRSLVMFSLIILLIWLSIEFRPIINRVVTESLLFGALGALVLTGYAWFRYSIGTGWPLRGICWPVFKLKEPIKIPLGIYLQRILVRTLIAYGLLVGLLPLLVVDFARSPHPEVLSNLVRATEISIASAIVFIPLMIFISGLRFYEFDKKIVPNQGIKLSQQNAIKAYLSALAITLFAFAIIDRIATGSWPIVWTGDSITNRPLQLLGLASTIAVIAGIVFGGFACLQHYALRMILSMKKDTPLNYRKFLDFAADSVLLRRIGGGYEFIHEYVRDYFEALNVQTKVRR